MANEFRNAIGFRSFSFDASNLIKNGGHPTKILPLMDEEKNTITNATFQKHFKFALNVKVAPKDEKGTYKMMMACLIHFCDIPSEFFGGQASIPKQGLIVFHDTDATIRLWNSKQIGKSVIYEVTVSSYKDAVPQPLEDKPSQFKRVVVNDKK